MRLEFLLTIDDFREATETTLVAATRPSGSLQGVSGGFQLATLAAEAVLVWKFDPSAPGRSQISDIVNFLITPSVPWLIILMYSLWANWKSVPIAAMTRSPWEMGNAGHAGPIRKKPRMKLLRNGLNGLLVLAASIGAIVVPVRGFLHGAHDGSATFLYAAGLAFTPWGIYMLWAAASWQGQARRKIDSSWQRQTQLHQPISMQFADSGIICETQFSRTDFKWNYFAGTRETPALFVLYASPLSFYIVPKRAAALEADVDGLRNMFKQFVGVKSLGSTVSPGTTVSSQ